MKQLLANVPPQLFLDGAHLLGDLCLVPTGKNKPEIMPDAQKKSYVFLPILIATVLYLS